jgi:hypothetical protein
LFFACFRVVRAVIRLSRVANAALAAACMSCARSYVRRAPRDRTWHEGVGFRVKGLGFGVEGLGIRV